MEQLHLRRNFYALLSRIFLEESSPDAIEKLLSNDELLTLLPNLQKEKALILENLRSFASEVLNVDYANLFLIHLIPYESFYKREDAMMSTGKTNPVAQFFEQYHFEIDLEKARVVAPDHIGCELEFMLTLIDAEAKALELDGDKAQKSAQRVELAFMTSHLMSWAPQFLMQVRNEADTAFYRDFADLALDFLFNDFEYLNKNLEGECA